MIARMGNEKRICAQCKREFSFHAARNVCEPCYCALGGQLKNYNRTGRKPGSGPLGETKNQGHRLPVDVHAFISANKQLIVRMARENYEIQFKMGVGKVSTLTKKTPVKAPTRAKKPPAKPKRPLVCWCHRTFDNALDFNYHQDKCRD